NAKRIYATLIHAKINNDGFKEQGITFPSSKMQERLFQEFYKECSISPSCVTYLEAHSTGTRAGDTEEVKAIDKVFCKDKSTPLLIGSIKSNLGHTEGASGLCHIAKVVIAMETGVIPAHINLTQERNDIEAFKKGTIRVVTASTLWEPSLAGVNSFGFGGTNAHVLLAPNIKKKINGGAPKDDLPRLVVLSGRTEQAVESFLHEIESQPVDVEYIRLLHDLYADEMLGHSYRGYTIVESQTLNNVIHEIEHYPKVRKPICYVFSGIGSQWIGMGKSLMQFPIFLKTIEKCDTILKSYGIHINNILTSKQETTFDSILNSVVGISVIQLGLIDLLMSVNIMPHYVIGHSIGELCCGYVTGDFTFEQVILSAYYIGRALSEFKIVQCSTVNIGLGYESVEAVCPEDIEVICRNSPKSCYISGPTESIKAFTTKLQDSEIFTKEVACNNIPLHSSYLAIATKKILAYLCQIIPQKMIRSQVWRRLLRDTELSYAEYFTNSLITPVFFENVATMIPENVVLVEIAPDGILQSVLKEMFDTVSITLVQRDHEDNVQIFLQGVGKMYNCGLQPQLANLYPTVEFPVSRGTPMISPSIKWKHSEDWHVDYFFLVKKINSGERIVNISLEDEDYQYMSGHVIDGKNLIPATGYLFFIWETIGMLWGYPYYNIPIVFKDVKFIQAAHIPSKGSIQLTLMVQKATGTFEVIEKGTAIVTGRVCVPSDPIKERVPDHYLQKDHDEMEVMKTKDIYKELKLRGYQFSGLFRGLRSSSATGIQGHIAWVNNWVTFMDNMLQMQVLCMDTRSLYVGTGIQKLLIDPRFHAQHIQNTTTEEKQLAVRVYKHLGMIVSGGVQISGISHTLISRRKPIVRPILEEHRFIAHRDGAMVSLEEGATLSMHLILEYHQITQVNIIELIEDDDKISTKNLLSPMFVKILCNYPSHQSNVNLIMRTNNLDRVTLPPEIIVSEAKKLSKEDNAILITGCNLLTRSKRETLTEILQALKSNGFLLTRGHSLTENDITNAKRYNLAVVLEKNVGDEHITLLKKITRSINKTEVVFVNNYEFSWLDQLKITLRANNELTNTTRIIIVGQGDAECGLLGLINCLKKEPSGELIRGMFIQDENASKFSLQDPFYAEQLQLDLVTNVLRPGKLWGSYRHLPLTPLKPRLVHHAFINQMV
ncbi:PREDICTED: fatty acid synthase-like, partial [Dinoponera quadriceps]|uniref:Fatty acid synthase-like n=1 Tax=Dinoponera quadriceps TaxID=609295 RepID=A0A6P3YAD4_DINQU